ncbi:MAG: hypothetical protein ACP5KV_06290 [Candidatus Methanomethylicaceae archaeon]
MVSGEPTSITLRVFDSLDTLIFPEGANKNVLSKFYFTDGEKLWEFLRAKVDEDNIFASETRHDIELLIKDVCLGGCFEFTAIKKSKMKGTIWWGYKTHNA